MQSWSRLPPGSRRDTVDRRGVEEFQEQRLAPALAHRLIIHMASGCGSEHFFGIAGARCRWRCSQNPRRAHLGGPNVRTARSASWHRPAWIWPVSVAAEDWQSRLEEFGMDEDFHIAIRAVAGRLARRSTDTRSAACSWRMRQDTGITELRPHRANSHGYAVIWSSSSGCPRPSTMPTFNVCRAKARFPSGRQTHPATFAPAGSNRSSRGGDETAEASGVEGHFW